MIVHVLIVHNETRGDRFDRFDPVTSTTMRPICELRFYADTAVTVEAVANRVYALANGFPESQVDAAMSDAYYANKARSLSAGDLLSIVFSPIDKLTGSVDVMTGSDAPVWLSCESTGWQRRADHEIPSSALPSPSLPLVDLHGMVF